MYWSSLADYGRRTEQAVTQFNSSGGDEVREFGEECGFAARMAVDRCSRSDFPFTIRSSDDVGLGVFFFDRPDSVEEQTTRRPPPPVGHWSMGVCSISNTGESRPNFIVFRLSIFVHVSDTANRSSSWPFIVPVFACCTWYTRTLTDFSGSFVLRVKEYKMQTKQLHSTVNR